MRHLARSFFGLALAGLLGVAACDSETQSLGNGDPQSSSGNGSGAGGSTGCPELVPGAVMTGIDYGADAEHENTFPLLMQAVADFAAATNGMAEGATGGCEDLALGLGAPAGAGDGPDLEARVTAWCAVAAEELAAVAGGASFAVSLQDAHCVFSGARQGECEGQCIGAPGTCDLDPAGLEARCDPAALAGTCPAECTGACAADEGTSAECSGVCNGACLGSCWSEPDGDACAGTCQGSCAGSCLIEGDAAVACSDTCIGGCTVELTSPVCHAPLSPAVGQCGAGICRTICAMIEAAAAPCIEPGLGLGAAVVSPEREVILGSYPSIVAVPERGLMLADHVLDLADTLDPFLVDPSPKVQACTVAAASLLAQSVNLLEATAESTAATSAALF